MKILAISAFYPPDHGGGYGLRLKEIFDGLCHRGHQVFILTNHAKKNLENGSEEKGIIFRSLHLKSNEGNVFFQIIKDCKDLFFLNSILNQIQPDIVYLGHIQNLSNTILPYFSKHNYPLIFDEGGSGIIYLQRMYQRGIYFYRNPDDSIFKKIIKVMVYWFARVVSFGLINPDWEWPVSMRVFYNSQSSKENAINLGAPVHNAEVIYSGMDLSKFPYLEREGIGSPVKIIMPTRIKEQKRCLDGIQLVHQLSKRNIKAELRIIGEVQSESYYRELINAVKEWSLEESVKIQRMVSQQKLGQLYRISDICFFSSYFKTGFSRVPMEAMASGCLVLAYGNEGSNEVIDHNNSGLLIDEGNIEEAAEFIEMLIQEPRRYQKIICNARKKIESSYGLENYIDSLEALIYKSIDEF